MRFSNISLFAVALCSQTAFAFDSTEKYGKREIQGFTILVNPEVEKHPEEAKAAFNRTRITAQKINDAVPEKTARRDEE